MIRICRYLLVGLVAIGLTAGRSYADAPPVGSFVVTGDVKAGGKWDAARINTELKADVQVVQYDLKGEHHSAHCVPLLDVINAAQPALNAHIKHHDLQFIVQVQAFDGYSVVFSMAELLPEIGNRDVWIALDEDGKPLQEDAGACRLVVPEDKKPARWIYGITSINVIDGSKLPSTSG